MPVVTAKTILFGDYGREWLKIKEQTTKPSTFKEYERSFRVDLEPTFGNKPLADITRTDLQNYLFGIVGENKHRKAEKFAFMLNCIFDMAAEDYNILSPHEEGCTARLPDQNGQRAHKGRGGAHCQLLQIAQKRRRYGRFAGTSLFRPAKIRIKKH